MCKYCEQVVRENEYLVSFYSDSEMYMAYDKIDGAYNIWTHKDNNNSSKIEYCPWCGRKLEATESTNEIRDEIEDEVARLEGRINHTHLIIKKICDDLCDYANGYLNKYLLADRLMAYKNKL